jgi:hypothetical protein
MKLLHQFNFFLKNVVNLNQTRINELEDHVRAIQDFLQNGSYGPEIISFSPQGSWAHKTIIKPGSSKEFDADLVMFIKRNQDWFPKDYVNNLYYIFQRSDRYKNKVSRGTRCVTLDYAGDFHLDIVPCIVHEHLANTFHVCDRNENQFEPTAPEAYSDWLSERNNWTGENMLQNSIRLLKYLRDIKGRFSVKSILLTTLIANCVYDGDKNLKNQHFSDLPTSLKTLIGRLDGYLQTNSRMPLVQSPVLPSETFNRHWDQEKYKNFKKCIHRYREWIDDAYEEKDRTDSIQKWRRVFGDEFAGEVDAVATFSDSPSLSQATGCRDIVNAALLKGSSFLESFISPKLPHVKQIPWFMRQKLSVVIYATEYLKDSANKKVRRLESGDIVEKDRSIYFEARNKNGILYSSSDFDVKWQIVNTDSEAAQANQLRGSFEDSSQPGVRWESTLYRGAHWVEAFIISRRERCCWGRSGRFFVVVK